MSGIRKARRAAYRAGRGLGDIEAMERAARRGSLAPVAKRVARRVIGRQTSRALRALFR